MELWEVILLGVALAMDACAVAMTDGMCESKMPIKRAFLTAAMFGFFQFMMPMIGYFITGIVAEAFFETFEKISSWISFLLLGFLGGKMIVESIKEMCENKKTTGTGGDLTVCPIEKRISFSKLLLQAVATSIDALAVGVTLQMAKISQGLALGVWGSTVTIGIVTLFLSFGAVFLGKAVGNKLSDKAGFFGGVVLVCIGVKLLLDGIL